MTTLNDALVSDSTDHHPLRLVGAGRFWNREGHTVRKSFFASNKRNESSDDQFAEHGGRHQTWDNRSNQYESDDFTRTSQQSRQDVVAVQVHDHEDDKPYRVHSHNDSQASLGTGTNMLSPPILRERARSACRDELFLPPMSSVPFLKRPNSTQNIQEVVDSRAPPATRIQPRQFQALPAGLKIQGIPKSQYIQEGAYSRAIPAAKVQSRQYQPLPAGLKIQGIPTSRRSDALNSVIPYRSSDNPGILEQSNPRSSSNGDTLFSDIDSLLSVKRSIYGRKGASSGALAVNKETRKVADDSFIGGYTRHEMNVSPLGEASDRRRSNPESWNRLRHYESISPLSESPRYESGSSRWAPPKPQSNVSSLSERPQYQATVSPPLDTTQYRADISIPLKGLGPQIHQTSGWERHENKAAAVEIDTTSMTSISPPFEIGKTWTTTITAVELDPTTMDVQTPELPGPEAMSNRRVPAYGDYGDTKYNTLTGESYPYVEPSGPTELPVPLDDGHEKDEVGDHTYIETCPDRELLPWFSRYAGAKGVNFYHGP